MIIGIFLAKGNFVVKLESSDTSAIGYHIRMLANISFRTYDMLNAFSRTLEMYGIQHNKYGSAIRLGRVGATKVMEMVPESLLHLNPKLSMFRTVSDIVEKKGHRTLEGLNQIIEILYGENNGINNNEH